MHQAAATPSLGDGFLREVPARERLIRRQNMAGLIVLLLLTAVVVGAVLSTALSGSTRKSTPPGAGNRGGTIVIEGVGMAPYTVLTWTVPGTRVMILDNMIFGENCEHYGQGHTSSEDPVAYESGGGCLDEVCYTFEATSNNGGPVNFALQGIAYDLSNGGLFLVRLTNDEYFTVEQAMVDLWSTLDLDAIDEFAVETEVILNFVAEVGYPD